MADGGDHFGYKDPDLDYDIDHDDDDKEEEVYTTRPFQPGAASTPYHGGEQHEMQTMMHEHSGLPDTSYAEMPLLGDSDPIGKLQQESFLRQKMKRAVDFIRDRYPKADFEKLKIRRGKGKAFWKIDSIGKRGGQYQILKNDELGFTKSFFDTFKNELGPTAEKILADRDTEQEQRQRLEAAEKEQREAEKIAAEREKELRELENLKQQTERAQARIDAL